jgi:hypothetical protein
VVQRKIEELQQTICQMQKDHKKDREETLMAYKGALEQAEEKHNKASNERDRLAFENNKLREDLEEYSRDFQQEVAGSPWSWAKNLVQSFVNSRSKPSPWQIQQIMVAANKQVVETTQKLERKEAELTQRDEKIAEAKKNIHALKEDVGQKEAGMGLLQTDLDRAKQLHHETDEKLNRFLSVVKSFVLYQLKPDLEECMCKTAEIKACLDNAECQNPGKSNETKFKVEHLHPGSEPDMRVITCCSDQCHNIFEDLASRASERFEHFGLAKERLFFQYTDSEGDTISVCSSVELKEAICQFQSSTPKLKLCQRSPPSEMDQQAGSGVTTDEAAGRS